MGSVKSMSQGSKHEPKLFRQSEVHVTARGRQIYVEMQPCVVVRVHNLPVQPL